MISVIMVTHNRETLVGDMIEDILGQTFTEFEYIIVDNCSVDQSGIIAKKYAERDSRIKVITLKEDVSIGKARNIGFACSSGDFVTFIDDDDRVERDFLEFLMRLVKNEKIDFVMCGATEKIGNKITPQCVFEKEYHLNAQQAVVELLKRERIRAGMPTKLFRREILKNHPFKEDCKHEDIHTIYKYLSDIREGTISGIPKYCFVRHGNNLSYFTTDFSTMCPEQLEEYIDAFRERTIYIESRFPEIKDFVQYSEWSYMISMCHKIKEYKLKFCMPQYEKMRDELNKNKQKFFNSKYIKAFEKEWVRKYID